MSSPYHITIVQRTTSENLHIILILYMISWLRRTYLDIIFLFQIPFILYIRKQFIQYLLDSKAIDTYYRFVLCEYATIIFRIWIIYKKAIRFIHGWHDTNFILNQMKRNGTKQKFR